MGRHSQASPPAGQQWQGLPSLWSLWEAGTRGPQPVNPRTARLGWDRALQGRPVVGARTPPRKAPGAAPLLLSAAPCRPPSPARANREDRSAAQCPALPVSRPAISVSLPGLSMPPSPRLARTRGRPRGMMGLQAAGLPPGPGPEMHWAGKQQGGPEAHTRALAHDTAHTHGLRCAQTLARAPTGSGAHHMPTLPAHSPHAAAPALHGPSLAPLWAAPWTVQPGGPQLP